MGISKDIKDVPYRRIPVGFAGGKDFSHGECLSAMPTDAELKRMDIGKLRQLAFDDPEREDGIRTERYRAPSDFKASDSMGRRPNEEYDSVCRAWIWLAFRREQGMEAAERMGESRQAISIKAVVDYACLNDPQAELP